MKRGNAGVVLKRTSLCGRGEEILILVVAESTPAQLTDWLKLPIELSRSGDAVLLDRNQCCNERHKGEELLEFVMARATEEQWHRWLRIPLEHAMVAGKSLLVKPLLAAGAELAGVGVGKGPPATVGGAGTTTVTAADEAPRDCCGGDGSRTKSAECCTPPSPSPSSSSSQETVVGVHDAGSPSSCCPSPTPASPDHAAALAAAYSRAPSPSSSCCPNPPPSPASGCRPPPSRSPSIPLEANAAAAAAVLLASPHCSSAPSASCSPGGRNCGSGHESSYPVVVPRTPCPEAKAAAAAAAACVSADPLCLHRATMAGDVGRMRELLAAGVDRNAIDLWECTALHRAAEQDGSAEPVRLLLAAGLDVRARDVEGYTALHFAAARGAETAIVDLLAAGSCLADRGNNGDTPLHSAVRFLSLATVRILLDADADEDAKNNDRETPGDVTGVLPDGNDIENQPDPLVAQRILALLEGSPQRRRDRVWRRRGWIVMLRARAQAQAARELAEAARTGCLVVVRSESSVSEGGGGAVSGGCGGGTADGGDAEECHGGDSGGDCGGGGGGSAGESSGDVGDDSADGCCGGDGGDEGGEGDSGTEVVKERGFAELVDQTTLLAEEGVFQKVLGFL